MPSTSQSYTHYSRWRPLEESQWPIQFFRSLYAQGTFHPFNIFAISLGAERMRRTTVTWLISRKVNIPKNDPSC